jgi:hypothetical protein
VSDDHRYRPKRLRGGVVGQSGLDLRPRSQRYPNMLNPALRPMRGVVVNTYDMDHVDNLRKTSVECDVLLVKTQVTLHNVPVMQPNHGVNNAHGLWRPRPATRVVGADGQPMNLGRTLSRRGTFVGTATPLGDVDGEQVLVDFIEGNKDFPIVVCALSHGRSNRRIVSGVGWREGEVETRGEMRQDEHYTHHHGAELRINEQGDFLIDTVGAYSDPSTEAADGAGGQVRVRVKSSERLTIAMGDDEDVFEVWKDGNNQLRVDIGEGATERLVLGDAFREFLNNFFDSKFDSHTHLAGTLAAPSGGGAVQGVTGAPEPSHRGTSMGANLLSDLGRTKKS